mmetsp:Transcript_131196/g.379495  ORF Transcript_131196/g.379495 Transcript_131196/m.379495 type:complete len:369 (+) Transcript_131196:100-1206(+)
MRSCAGCCLDADAGGDIDDIRAWQDQHKVRPHEAAPLLERSRVHSRTPPVSGLCSPKWVCGGICCLMLLGLIAMAIYVASCVRSTMNQESIVLPLAKDREGGQYFTLQNMTTIPRDRWDVFSLLLTEPWTTAGNYSFGYATPDRTPSMLFEGSKAEGVFEEIPDKLRGVWWMRGNPIAEVLAVVQYGKWFEKEKTLLVPNAPWTWAWWGGEANEYPKGLDWISKLVYGFASGRSIAESYTDLSAIDTLVSFVFEPCPDGAECEEGAENLAYAKLMSHASGDLTKHGMVYYDGYTMEEMSAEEVTNDTQRNGSRYFRRSELFCGLFGRGTGYNLTKILDGYGNKVEPYFSEYIDFMAGRPLIIWSNIPE